MLIVSSLFILLKLLRIADAKSIRVSLKIYSPMTFKNIFYFKIKLKQLKTCIAICIHHTTRNMNHSYDIKVPKVDFVTIYNVVLGEHIDQIQIILCIL